MLFRSLKDSGIGSEIYYPVPFHKQECFTYLPVNPKISFTNADYAASHSMALPIYPELSEEQIKYVVEKIKEFLNN